MKYKLLSYSIAVGATLSVNQQGNGFHVIDANQTFEVGFDRGPQSSFFKGLEYEAPDNETFSSVQITNTSQGVLNVQFGISSGGVRDGRLTLTGAINAEILAPDTLVTGDPVSAANSATTQLAAANTGRREIMMVNVHASSTIYIGGAGATAGQGIPVLAGQSLTLTTSAAIFARNDSGGAVSVAVAELVAS
jgi:hypothetical protein